MKRKGYLYEKIISLENLQRAFNQARRGKNHYQEVKKWNFWSTLNLHNELKNKTYCVGEYSIFTIYEPKERIISKLPFRDRVVHHAIILVIGDILKDSLISQTYACLKGRGIHRCLKDLNKYLEDKKDTKYCLKMDIKKFYPTIPNDLLKQKLRRKFKDPDLLRLLDLIIDSTVGLPLGSYTSQYFANFYLNEFDHWIKQELKLSYYGRYCDDFYILHSNKEYLYWLKHEIIRFLDKEGLELSNYQVFPVDKRGVNLVGYISDHNSIKLRKSIKNNFKHMLKYNPNIASYSSYNGWFKYTTTLK